MNKSHYWMKFCRKEGVYYLFFRIKEFLSIEMLGNEGKPVILVPKFAKNGNICLANAANFLVDGK